MPLLRHLVRQAKVNPDHTVFASWQRPPGTLVRLVCVAVVVSYSETHRRPSDLILGLSAFEVERPDPIGSGLSQLVWEYAAYSYAV